MKKTSRAPLIAPPAADSAPTPVPIAKAPRPVADPDTAGRHLAEQAAADREALYDEVENASWNGRLLQPYSAGRAALLARLVKADLPCQDLDDLPLLQARLDALKTSLTDPQENAAAASLTLAELTGHYALYAPTACKVLFLCSHPPEAFDPLRGSAPAFIRAIEEWSELNVRPHQYEAACLLAQKLTAAHRAFLVIPRQRTGAAADQHLGE